MMSARFIAKGVCMKVFIGSQRGQGLTEYAVVLSLVAVAAIAATAFFGGAVKARIAALAAAVAGDTQQSVSNANKTAVKAARNANEASQKVGGMRIEHSGTSSADGAEVIDDVTLGGGAGE
jgi:Flp pilus assembly pilin Flp